MSERDKMIMSIRESIPLLEKISKTLNNKLKRNQIPDFIPDIPLPPEPDDDEEDDKK